MEAPFHSLAHYNIRSDKGNPTVIKRSKMPFLGVLLLTTGLWDLKNILNLRQNRSKNKLVGKNALTRAHENCSLRIMGSWPRLRHFHLKSNLTCNMNVLYRKPIRLIQIGSVRTNFKQSGLSYNGYRAAPSCSNSIIYGRLIRVFCRKLRPCSIRYIQTIKGFPGSICSISYIETAIWRNKCKIDQRRNLRSCEKKAGPEIVRINELWLLFDRPSYTYWK